MTYLEEVIFIAPKRMSIGTDFHQVGSRNWLMALYLTINATEIIFLAKLREQRNSSRKFSWKLTLETGNSTRNSTRNLLQETLLETKLGSRLERQLEAKMYQKNGKRSTLAWQVTGR